ncbi:solute carrier family 12 member 9-like isoform X2 [Mya arenaria]|uniref:solute carrier family 12 member 9-like isoform X2 n=1 Tax=Mya arenaria TaxID=6604 RepID=UPI0022E15BE7|nr:solute carrier family 12 member 9-like isoform X2 [Mya arenaria]
MASLLIENRGEGSSVLGSEFVNNENYGSHASISDDGVSQANSDDVPLIHSPMVWRLPRHMSMRTISVSENARRTLNTFSGVFCPVALSMFSTFLFLRIGLVIGQAGILITIVQMLLAYLILLLTVFSICAISTNGAVEGGGAYYMISRALGPEFGGSIGFLFYVANVLACALYVTGFTEAIMENFSQGGTYVSATTGLPTDADGAWWKYLYASVVLLICLLVCMVGGSLFAKTLTVILLITIVCTLSVFISVFAENKEEQIGIPKENTRFNSSNLTFAYTGLRAKTFHQNAFLRYTNASGVDIESFQVDYSTGKVMNFETVFAILFSSVTGIMNGANMSGELKDPSKSIPKGTLAAICFTFCTYFILVILVGGSCSRDLLINNYLFLQDINWWSGFVLIGIFATTLSAALGNLIGASRILEALANDRLFGIVLNPATKTTRGGNPYGAVLISWFLVQLVLLVGSLNAIAPPTTVFFLLSYASTNLACAALDLASAPNFRPTFKYFSWHTSLLGLLGCMVMCFLISSIYTSVAIIIMLVLIIVLHLRSVPSEWGSISQALIFHQVRKYLLMLDIRKSHVKYWRPQILLMVSRPKQSPELIDFINDIKKGGLYVIGHVRKGHLDDFKENDPLYEENLRWMKLVDRLQIKAFVELTLARTICDGLHNLIRSAGIGGLKTNTVCLGFYDNHTPEDALAKFHYRRKRFFGTVSHTGQPLDVGENFRGTRNGDKDLAGTEYVKMIADSLKMHKNVMLCRHFHQLDKESIKATKGTLFIDVWPVNFFRPETASYFDNTCLFLLQLACIINMVPGWKSKARLRVFLFVNAHSENATNKEHKLENYLRQLRINAKIQVVSWESIAQSMVSKEFDLSVNYSESRMQEYNHISTDFLQAINKTIVSFSKRTAVTFLYLPRPPEENVDYERYLAQLDGLSDNLPPTVFVHGLHPVTSTTL